MLRVVAFVVGWLVVGVCALVVIVGVGSLLSGRDKLPAASSGLVAFFAVVGYLGYRLATTVGAGPKPLTPEQEILALAARLGGKVTLAEVVLHCKLGVPQARDVLGGLVRQGLANLHLTDGGDEVYAFTGLDPGEKKSAKDPFEA